MFRDPESRVYESYVHMYTGCEYSSCSVRTVTQMPMPREIVVESKASSGRHGAKGERQREKEIEPKITTCMRTQTAVAVHVLAHTVVDLLHNMQLCTCFQARMYVRARTYFRARISRTDMPRGVKPMAARLRRENRTDDDTHRRSRSIP